jgi:hypothetical protein
MERDFYIALELHDCGRWKDKDDIKDAVETIIKNESLIPLQKKRVELPDGFLANLVTTDMDTWFQTNYYLRDTWDDMEFSTLRPKERFVAILRTTLREEWKSDHPLIDAINISIDANKYEDQYNFVLISTTLFNVSNYLADPKLKSFVNEVPQLLARLAIPLARRLEPSYGAVTHKRYLETYGHDVINTKLKYVHWFNLYGSRYIGRYGKQVLLNAPAWMVDELNNHSIVLQLAPNYIPSAQPKDHMKEDLLQYFNPYGVREITWP